ncbi:M20/M25/M40 family metallo-hydrolase [Vogesella sp. GCM10023246]|uniref:M20/M25/M40 family metallo-hydrolase n=1 Tax=Vogesella oryzagri TaxID=3160864 RepID=A0ABV1LYU5_9NEIS
MTLTPLLPLPPDSDTLRRQIRAQGDIGRDDTLDGRRMTSGAGHDAQMIARIAPAAMIFVSCHGGISHTPREHTDDSQLRQGAQVLLDAVASRLPA